MTTLFLVPPSPDSPEQSTLPPPACAPDANAEPSRPARVAFLGDSPAAREVELLVEHLATSSAAVVIEGETGVGKTFLARIIHERSARATAPFRAVNCAAIAEGLLESTLFGHERGAFTGAVSTHIGVLEAAGAGTVFLDEIGEMTLANQAKLLHALGEGRFTRLGSTREIELRARVLAATNRDLDAMRSEGRFRDDLFYRLAAVEMRVPALRERGDDVVKLARHLLEELKKEEPGKEAVDLAPDAIEAIRRYRWPGNVRELEHAIQRALVMGKGDNIAADDLPAKVRARPGAQEEKREVITLPCSLPMAERRIIEAALENANGSATRAAQILGVARGTVYNRMRALGIARKGRRYQS